MRKISAGRLLGSVCLLLSAGLYLQAQTGAPARPPLTQRGAKLNRAVSERHGKIMKQLQPEARKKLAVASRALLKEMERSPGPADLEEAARAQVSKQFGGLSGVQLDVLSFYVLADVARSEKESLEKKDSLSEQGEQQQLRMQAVMDRMTKADSAASNALKKFSGTASRIVGNLK